MNRTVKFCTRYNYPDIVSPHGGVSMTDQQYRDECDIDVILKRYKAGQQLPETQRKGTYGDFSDVGDFMSCFERINAAREDFAALPADLRARFGNDVTAFYNFVLDPANVAECERLGLRVKPDTPPVSPSVPEKVESTQNGESSATK